MIGLINMGTKPGLIQREELGLRVFENRVLREMLGSNIRKTELVKLNKNCIIRSFIIFTPHRFYYCHYCVIQQRRKRYAGKRQHVWDKREINVGFWWGNVKRKTTWKN
jgi:hypothetical protein